MNWLSSVGQHIRKSLLSKISTLTTVVSFILGIAGFNFIIPRIGWLTISVIALFAILLDAYRQIYNENLKHQNPDVEFGLQVGNAGLINENFFTEGLKPIGEVEFSVHLEIHNKSNEPLSIKFEIVDINTTLPIVQKKYPLSVQGKISSRDDIFQIAPNDWDKNVYAKTKLEFEFYPVEEKIPQIGQAKYLNIKLRATQANGSFADRVIEIQNPSEKFEDIFVKRIIQRLQHNTLRQTSPQELIGYLKLFWKSK